MHAVRNGTVVEQRGEHFVHRLQDRCLTTNVQESFLLSRKRCFRQIFRGGGGAHSNGNFLAAAHFTQLFEYGCVDFRRKGGRKNPAANFCAGGRQFSDIVDIEVGQLGPDTGVQASLFQKLTVGVRRGGETGRDLDAELGESTDHFAERGVFTAYRLDIVHSKLLEGDHVCVQRRSSEFETSDITLATLHGQ